MMQVDVLSATHEAVLTERVNNRIKELLNDSSNYSTVEIHYSTASATDANGNMHIVYSACLEFK